MALALESPGYRADQIYTAQIYAAALWVAACRPGLFQEVREKRVACAIRSLRRPGPMPTPACHHDLRGHLRRAGRGIWLGITVDELKRAADDMSDARGGPRPRADEGGDADGAGEPVEPRGTPGASGADLGPRCQALEDTVARIDAVTTRDDVRAFAARMAVARPRLRLQSMARSPLRRASAGVRPEGAPPDASVPAHGEDWRRSA
ncbi:MAG: hypothetical protein EpisKO_30790 [Epibacterium sp.]